MSPRKSLTLAAHVEHGLQLTTYKATARQRPPKAQSAAKVQEQRPLEAGTAEVASDEEEWDFGAACKLPMVQTGPNRRFPGNIK